MGRAGPARGERRTRIFQFGHGPPLLLLPSAFLRASSYRPTIEHLAAHFRVTAAEMPGSGGSQAVERAWGFAEGADWAAALLDALDLSAPWSWATRTRGASPP